MELSYASKQRVAPAWVGVLAEVERSDVDSQGSRSGKLAGVGVV